MDPTIQPVADQASTLPLPIDANATPPPLVREQAGLGLDVAAIATRNGHSKVAIYAAIKRLNVQHLEFTGTRLYSEAQADFLQRKMRSPDNPSGKRTDVNSETSAQCHQN